MPVYMTIYILYYILLYGMPVYMTIYIQYYILLYGMPVYMTIYIQYIYYIIPYITIWNACLSCHRYDCCYENKQPKSSTLTINAQHVQHDVTHKRFVSSTTPTSSYVFT